MNPLSKLMLEAVVILALLLAVLAGVKAIDQRGYKRAEAEYTAVIEKQKREAGEQLATETAKTRAAEEALRSAKQVQDNKDAQAQSTVADLSRRLRQLTAGNAGRLRDPNAPGCGGGGGGAQSEDATAARAGAEDGTPAGGLLSAQLTGLLQQLTKEADDINNAYASCRADAYSVRGTP